MNKASFTVRSTEGKPWQTNGKLQSYDSGRQHLYETSREFGLSNSPDPHAIEVREEAFSMGRPAKPRAGIKQCRVQLAPSRLEFTLNCSCILFRFVQWPAMGQELYYFRPADILERSRVRLNRNWCQRSTLFMVDINFMIQTFYSC